MTANTMREAFEKHAYCWARSFTTVDGEYCDDEVNSAWLYFKAGAAWQAAQSGPAPTAAIKLLDDVIYDMEHGFVRCGTCGDQEDTKDLDFMSDLVELRAMLCAQSVPVVGEAVAYAPTPFSGFMDKVTGIVPLTAYATPENTRPLFDKPATSITAQELDALRKDAESYRRLVESAKKEGLQECAYPDCICPDGVSSGACNLGLPGVLCRDDSTQERKS